MPLAHLAIAFKGSAWTDPNSIPLMVIQSLWGSWNSSVGVGNCSGLAKFFTGTYLLLNLVRMTNAIK